MHCKLCNSQISDDATYCPNCGTAVNEEDWGATDVLNEDLGTDWLLGDEGTTWLGEGDEDDFPVGQIPPQQNYYNPQQPQPAQKQYYPPSQPQQEHYNPQQSQATAGNYNIDNGCNQQINQNSDFSEKLSYEEFYDKFASKSTKSDTKWVGIICIITAVFSLGIMVLTMNPLSLVDIIFYSVFAALVLKKKKWTMTMPVGIYGGVFTIIGLAISGTPSGIFATFISITATIRLKKLYDAYKQYLVTNQFPQAEI